MIAQAVLFACLLQLIVYVSSKFDIAPCTEYFQLIRNNETNEIFGRLEVPSTIKNNAVNVSINLDVPTFLNTSYIGEIKLDIPGTELLTRIEKGKHLKYRIYFPMQDPLPRITRLTLNNRPLCTSPRLVSRIVSTINLHHSLALPKTWLITSTTPLPVSTPTPHVTTTSTSTTSGELEATYGIPHIKFSELIRNFLYITSPWVAAIFRELEDDMVYTCAGTLISEKHVLTAAHCVMDEPELYTVSLGHNHVSSLLKKKFESHIIGQSGSTLRRSVYREVQHITVHPSYTAYNADSDLAIITMNNRIEFNSRIRPICLWTGNTSIQDSVGQYGTVVGWGQRNVNCAYTDTDKSRMVEVQIVSQDECLETYEDKGIVTVTDRTFCTNEPDIEMDLCNGSGNGLVMTDNLDRYYYLQGIMSTPLSENGDCDLTQHIVYVNVTHYTNWIRQQIASDI